jgi:hypothetical protein
MPFLFYLWLITGIYSFAVRRDGMYRPWQKMGKRFRLLGETIHRYLLKLGRVTPPPLIDILGSGVRGHTVTQGDHLLYNREGCGDGEFSYLIKERSLATSYVITSTSGVDSNWLLVVLTTRNIVNI